MVPIFCKVPDILSESSPNCRGSLYQNLYIESLALTSTKSASAMFNLVPAITIILAVSFGLEKLSLGTITRKAKVLGTLMGIGVAMLLTFYRGAEINIWSTHVDLLHQGQHQTEGHSAASPESENLLLGSILALGGCFSFASWLIIQTKLSERDPCHYSTAALMCVMGGIQYAVFALCMESDWSQWKLGWNIRLLIVSYSILTFLKDCTSYISLLIQKEKNRREYKAS